MYRDTEWNYKDWNCETFQLANGYWKVDFWHRSDPTNHGEVINRKKKTAEAEAKLLMDEGNQGWTLERQVDSAKRKP